MAPLVTSQILVHKGPSSSFVLPETVIISDTLPHHDISLVSWGLQEGMDIVKGSAATLVHCNEFIIGPESASLWLGEQGSWKLPAGNSRQHRNFRKFPVLFWLHTLMLLPESHPLTVGGGRHAEHEEIEKAFPWNNWKCQTCPWLGEKLRRGLGRVVQWCWNPLCPLPLCSMLLGLVVYMLLFAWVLIIKMFILCIKGLTCPLKAALNPFCRNKACERTFSFLWFLSHAHLSLSHTLQWKYLWVQCRMSSLLVDVLVTNRLRNSRTWVKESLGMTHLGMLCTPLIA